jgi:hypothetical protein
MPGNSTDGRHIRKMHVTYYSLRKVRFHLPLLTGDQINKARASYDKSDPLLHSSNLKRMKLDLPDEYLPLGSFAL